MESDSMTITDTTVDRAVTTARNLLSALTDPEEVRFDPDASPVRACPQSLAGGAAGVALAHVQAARTGHGPWATAHTWLTHAFNEPITDHDNATLWLGAPALGLLLATAANDTSLLRQERAMLHTRITALTQRRLEAAEARIDQGTRPSLAEFDLIEGLTGAALYHLHTQPDTDLTRRVLTYLVRLTHPLPDDEQRPGWWSDRSPRGVLSPDWPDGHLNLGMAHGISAPLAVLALAVLRGIIVNGQIEAIERVCTVLDARRRHGPTGTWWPYHLSQRQLLAGSVDIAPHQRPSWCYGTPGLARAQQLAGLALGDDVRQRVAVQAMADCLRDTAQLDTLTETGLCHGLSGLLHCAWRVNADAPGTALDSHLDRVAGRLLNRLEEIDQVDPEFLDGHAGTALALLTYATGAAPGVPWDAYLALA